jgi:poly[(R)-3-hydroxyalkanoate] polymerase subunit PhaC
LLLTANGSLRLLFTALDAHRRLQRLGLGALRFGPLGHRHRIVASGRLWRLRCYPGPDVGPTVFIVAAPIKRAYIWDLAPSASAVRFCLRRGLRIYLLEWKPPQDQHAICGLADYADDAISEALGAVLKEVGTVKPFLMGHSLGATFAAIFGALHPERLSGLVLLSAPLCLYPGVSPFRDALATVPPWWLADMEIVPGSLISLLSAIAAPTTFVWSKLWDSAVSAMDPRASEIRVRIEHWGLDEVPLPGKLVRDILEALYQENQLYNGTLVIGGRTIGPSCIRAPTLAVANTIDEVAPPESVIPFLEAMSGADTRFIAYPAEAGVVLQHLGILVGRNAYARIWPQIISWIRSHS